MREAATEIATANAISAFLSGGKNDSFTTYLNRLSKT